ncbi:MAG: hypothetical protein Q9174_001560 [Haloplaca sp. 1 TL-2023]
MADCGTSRRVLQDLSVNRFGSPKPLNLSSSAEAKCKRSIGEVEDPAIAPTHLRLRKSCNEENGSLKESVADQHVNTEISEAVNERNEDSTQETCNDVGSSFFDSDPDDTMNTQQTAATELSQPSHPTQSSVPTFSPVMVRHTDRKKHAEILRLRLRLALFKVQTDQTNIPLSQLRIPNATRQRDPVSAEIAPVPSKSPVRTLLPAPILKPTASSMRKNERRHFLSSPPSSGGSSPAESSKHDTSQESAIRHREVNASQQLSSPPASQDGHGLKAPREDVSLSSSAVKGHLAASLLDLRENRR